MDQIVMQQAETPAEGPDDAALAAAGENAVNAGKTHSDGSQPKENTQRPEWVPEKFWDAETGQVDTEGLAKSYQELERSRGQKQEGVLKIESVEQAQELATQKGIDFKALEKEFLSNGDLAQETYQELEAKGIPREQVLAFVQGQKASAQLHRAEILKEFGGEDHYAEMIGWAKESVGQDDIAAYNRAMATGDQGIIKMAIASLDARYKQANGSPPRTTVGGKTSGQTSVEAFGSREQYVDAIKDAKYDRDPAYRAQVLKRLQASTIF